MNSPAAGLPELAQIGFSYAADNYRAAPQAYESHNVHLALDPTLQTQSQGGQLATQLATELSHVPHSFNPSLAPSNHEYHEHHGTKRTADAQATPASPMGPPTRPRKRKAPTLHADAWEPYKARIVELHVKQRLPLKKVKEMIEQESGFTAELRQYRTRVTQWGKDKNVKPQEMSAIVRKRQQRKLVDVNKGELVFEVRGNPVESQKIDRWMKRHEVPESHLYAPSPAASTPSAVGCRTISERGSPVPCLANSPAASAFSPRDYLIAQSPQMPSPALSVSSIVQPQISTFAGQSPAPAYRSLTNVSFSPLYTPSALESSHGVALYRYKQTDEERLRDRLFRVETTFGPSHSETLDILYKLGAILIDQGRYKSAEEVIRQLVDRRRSLGGDNNVDTLQALDLLGRVLDHQGLYVKAERLYRRVYESRKTSLWVEHQDILISISYLGSVLESQGKYEEAEAMHRRALEGSEVLGPEHPDTFTSVDNLGSVLESQGKFDEAGAMHRRALQGREKMLGLEHPATLASVSNLGLVLRSQGKYNEAEAMHRRALEGREKVLGPEHPYTLSSVSNLGLVLQSQSKNDEAEVMHRRALEGREKVLGPEHPYTLASIRHLMLVLLVKGWIVEAEELEVRVIETRKKVLGKERADRLPAMANLAITLKP